MKSLVAVLILAIATAAGAVDFKESTVSVNSKVKVADGSWASNKTTILQNDFKQDVDQVNDYGSSMLWPQEKATGFFRVQKIDNRWWLIDPDGYRHIHVGIAGINIVNNSSLNKAAREEKYGGMIGWYKSVKPFLTENGFNGAGAWTNTVLMKNEFKIPHTRYYPFMNIYGRDKLTPNNPNGVPIDKSKMPNTTLAWVFEPDFESFVTERAKKMADEKDNKYLIGWFVDNELPLSTWSLNNFMKLNTDSAGYKAAYAWLAERQGTKWPNTTKFSIEDRQAFVAFVYETYLKIVTKAVRNVDPNHMIFGTKQDGDELYHPAMFKIMKKYCDVVSIDFYRKWEMTDKMLADWTEWSDDMPFYVAEWYVKANDSGLPNTTGAGWVVETQKDRGMFYQHNAMIMLKSKMIVGWDWFKYMDNDPAAVDMSSNKDDSDSNKGIMRVDYSSYDDFLNMMRNINVAKYTYIQQHNK